MAAPVARESEEVSVWIWFVLILVNFLWFVFVMPFRACGWAIHFPLEWNSGACVCLVGAA